MSKPMQFAWLLYFASLSLTGIIFVIGPAAVRPEHLCLPLLVLISAKLRRQGSSSMIEMQPKANYLLVVIGVLWVLVAFVVTLMRAPEASRSIWVLVQVATGIIAFLLVRPLTQEQKRSMVIAGSKFIAILCGISVSGFLLVSLAGLPYSVVLGVSSDLRLVGLSFEPNIFASQIVGWLAVVYYWRDRLPRWSGSAVLLMLAAVALAGTRAAWLALIFLVAYWVAAGYPKRPLLTIFSMFPVLIVGLWILTYTPAISSGGAGSPLLDRFFNILDTETGTGAYRLQIYDIAYADISASGRWLFGSGMNTFSQYNLIDPTNVGAAYLSSLWWALLYDVGIVGLVLFMSILGVAFFSSSHRFRAFPVFAVILICASTTNLIWFVYPWIYWALIDSSARGDGLQLRAVGGTGGIRTNMHNKFLYPSNLKAR